MDKEARTVEAIHQRINYYTNEAERSRDVVRQMTCSLVVIEYQSVLACMQRIKAARAKIARLTGE